MSDTPTQPNKSRLWLWFLLIPVALIGVALFFFQLALSSSAGAPSPSSSPADLSTSSSTVAPGAPAGSAAQDSSASPDSESGEDQAPGSTEMQAGDGAEQLTFSSESAEDFWAPIIFQVTTEADGSLAVLTSADTPNQNRSEVEGHAMEVCQRFAMQATDGETGFTLLTKDGVPFATNINEDGSLSDMCHMP